MIKDYLAKHLLEIAILFHEAYNENELRKDPQKEVTPWDKLDSDYKYSNIRIVENIDRKLDSIGCYITNDGGDPNIIKDGFRPDEREKLAILEHEMWMEEREESGWTFGANRNNSNKVHNLMKPWGDLNPDERAKDYLIADVLIEILLKYDIYVCRYPETEEIEFTRYYSGHHVPLILSVTGHTDLCSEDEDFIRGCLDRMLNEITSQGRGGIGFSVDDLILMSALAEGADRLVAKWAMGKGIHIAPVLPISIQNYEGTFRGIGYEKDDPQGKNRTPASIRASISDFESMLKDDLMYSPVIVSKGRTNRVKAFVELSAYLVSNSHLLIGVWDGRSYSSRGGTYDTIRMAYEGVDQELISTMPATSVVFDKSGTKNIASLNAGEDTLIYWIEVGRSSSPKDMEDKLCKNSERDPSRSCGYLYREDMQIGQLDDSFTRFKAIEKIKDRFIRRRVAPSTSPIKSGKVFETVDCRYDSIPLPFVDSFHRIRELNEDLDDYMPRSERDSADNNDGLYGIRESPPEIVPDDHYSHDLKNRFMNMYGMSSRYKYYSNVYKGVLSALQLLVTAFFGFMIMFSGALILNIVYSFFYLLFTVLMWRYRRRSIHTKYVEYRSLAESYRVQYYWSIVGINDTVTMNCYGYLKNGMSWVRAVLKSSCSVFTNNYFDIRQVKFEDRLVFVKKYWIDEKCQYLKKSCKGDIDFINLLTTWIKVMGVVGVVLAVVLSMLTVILPDINAVWFVGEPRDLFDLEVFPGFEMSPSLVVKMLMILSTFILGALIALREFKFADTPPQFRAKHLLYSLADSKLDTIGSRGGTHETRSMRDKMEILHEIGIQEIDQNNDWVFEFISKDIENVRGNTSYKDGGTQSGGNINNNL